MLKRSLGIRISVPITLSAEHRSQTRNPRYDLNNAQFWPLSLTIKSELIHGSKDKKGCKYWVTMDYQGTLPSLVFPCQQIHPTSHVNSCSHHLLENFRREKSKKRVIENHLYRLQLKIHQRAKETPKITARARATITTTSALRIAA